MLITLSFEKSLIVEQFQGNYLKQSERRKKLRLQRDPVEALILSWKIFRDEHSPLSKYIFFSCIVINFTNSYSSTGIIN